MNSITAETWFTLGSVLMSTIFIVSSLVWFLSKMKGEFDLQLNNVSNEVKLVQQTVNPYASEIEKNRSRILSLTDRTTKVEAKVDGQDSDIKRLEGRLDRMQKV